MPFEGAAQEVRQVAIRSADDIEAIVSSLVTALLHAGSTVTEAYWQNLINYKSTRGGKKAGQFQYFTPERPGSGGWVISRSGVRCRPILI